LVREPCAPLHPTPLKDVLAVGRLHADAESVRFLFVPVVGLIRALHRLVPDALWLSREVYPQRSIGPTPIGLEGCACSTATQGCSRPRTNAPLAMSHMPAAHNPIPRCTALERPIRSPNRDMGTLAAAMAIAPGKIKSPTWASEKPNCS